MIFVRFRDFVRATPSVVLLLAMLTAPPAARAAESEPLRRAWLLMGTACEVTLYAADSTGAAGAFDAAWRAMARVDSLMSLYRPESELCRINAGAARSPVEIDLETFAVLAAALDCSRRSGGAFDVTVKPLMDLWGFYRRTDRAPDDAAIDSVRALVDWRGVTLDADRRTVRLARPGMAIDLGGIAKGWAVDRAVSALRSRGIARALVNLGGNIYALGAPPDEPRGWPVGLRDPRFPDSLSDVVHLRDRAVASSGGYEKFVTLGGRRYGHILDPRRGRPVEGVLGTTVIAPDATTADALSTALFVLGPEAGARLAASCQGVEARIVEAPRRR